MEKLIKKKINRMVIVILFCLFVIITLISLLLSKDLGIWQNALFGIGTTGIATIIITIASNALMYTSSDNLIKQFENEIGKLNEFNKAGLRRVFLAREYHEYGDLIRQAKNIDIFYNVGYTFFRNHYTELIDALNHDCTIRILINNPSYDLFTIDEHNMREYREALNGGVYYGATDHHASIGFIEKVISSKKRTNRSEYRYMKCYPTGSLLIFDNSTCIFTPYLPYAISMDSMSFLINKTDSEFFGIFRRMFDSAWNNADRIEK